MKQTFMASPDARAFLKAVLDSEHGLKAIFESQPRAVNFVQRCNAVKTNVRKISKRIYAESDVAFGTGEYDSITLHVVPEPGGHCKQCQIALGAKFAVLAFKEGGDIYKFLDIQPLEQVNA